MTKFDVTKRLPEVDEALARTDNPRHIAILKNYVRHANLEVSGLWEGIVAPDMMVEHPVYVFHSHQGMRRIEGMAAVRAEYESYEKLGNTVIYHTDGHIMVDDFGFMTEYVSHRFWPGSLLRTMGDDVDDAKAMYLVSMTQMMNWPYDERARVVGERVYRGGDRKIRECDPAEVITMQECRDKLLPTLPEVHSPFTGKPWTKQELATA
ncbi:hypothetical protein [Ramlibacter algicola]|uniref:SnoaL-like domain-containing protein n=1 Tax=Ramlibacter algicola TaxID=2795217 RepID=A0A934Q0I5_9BURK|nr:hypothetical protein [Ramlibacter algicola]MBK0392566.1 hypothetical protein [Ramlibacter algicola]